jgi:hypothetical protein
MVDHLGCRGRAALLTTRTASQALLDKARAAKDQGAASAPVQMVSDGLSSEPSEANFRDLATWWEVER